MSYIGNQSQTAYSAMVKQDITGNGGTSYTLSHPVSNENDILLYINNVKQEGGSGKAFTASGTTLTLSEAIANTDTCYVQYIGLAIQTVVPPDGSVSTAKIADDAVSTAKLADDAVNLTSKVTGILPVANGGTGLSSAVTTPYFKLTKNGGQSTPNGATVTVTWQNTIYDTSSIVSISNDRVIITSATAGLYFVGASVQQDVLNFRQVVGIRKNGSNIARSEVATQTVANNGSRAPTLNVHTIIEMANTDYLDVSYISINGTNAVNLDSTGTYFYGWRIA